MRKISGDKGSLLQSNWNLSFDQILLPCLFLKQLIVFIFLMDCLNVRHILKSTLFYLIITLDLSLIHFRFDGTESTNEKKNHNMCSSRVESMMFYVPNNSTFPHISSNICFLPLTLFLEILSYVFTLITPLNSKNLQNQVTYICPILNFVQGYVSGLYLVSKTNCNKLIQVLLLLLSHFSHVQLCVTLWTIPHQAPLSMEFSR